MKLTLRKYDEATKSGVSLDVPLKRPSEELYRRFERVAWKASGPNTTKPIILRLDDRYSPENNTIAFYPCSLDAGLGFLCLLWQLANSDTSETGKACATKCVELIKASLRACHAGTSTSKDPIFEQLFGGFGRPGRFRLIKDEADWLALSPHLFTFYCNIVCLQ